MSRESLNNERIRNDSRRYVTQAELDEACDYAWAEYYKNHHTDGNAVNHPDHYNQNGYECIDIMLATQGIDAVKSFCLCNAFKYIYRHREKNHVEDIKKAIWYLNKFIELEESNNEK